MATPKTANDHVSMVTGLFYDRDSAERAFRSIIGRGYDKDEINLALADETRKVLFPEGGLVTDLALAGPAMLAHDLREPRRVRGIDSHHGAKLRRIRHRAHGQVLANLLIAAPQLQQLLT